MAHVEIPNSKPVELIGGPLDGLKISVRVSAQILRLCVSDRSAPTGQAVLLYRRSLKNPLQYTYERQQTA